MTDLALARGGNRPLARIRADYFGSLPSAAMTLISATFLPIISAPCPLRR